MSPESRVQSPEPENETGVSLRNPQSKEARFVKGPLNRIDLDVRRVWECPNCHQRRKSDGEITAKRCYCEKGGTWMLLVEAKRQVRSFPRPAAPPAEPPDEPTVEPETESEAGVEVTSDDNAAVESSSDEDSEIETTNDG